MALAKDTAEGEVEKQEAVKNGDKTNEAVDGIANQLATDIVGEVLSKDDHAAVVNPDSENVINPDNVSVNVAEVVAPSSKESAPAEAVHDDSVAVSEAHVTKANLDLPDIEISAPIETPKEETNIAETELLHTVTEISSEETDPSKTASQKVSSESTSSGPQTSEEGNTIEEAASTTAVNAEEQLTPIEEPVKDVCITEGDSAAVDPAIAPSVSETPLEEPATTTIEPAIITEDTTPVAEESVVAAGEKIAVEEEVVAGEESAIVVEKESAVVVAEESAVEESVIDVSTVLAAEESANVAAEESAVEESAVAAEEIPAESSINLTAPAIVEAVVDATAEVSSPVADEIPEYKPSPTDEKYEATKGEIEQDIDFIKAKLKTPSPPIPPPKTHKTPKGLREPPKRDPPPQKEVEEPVMELKEPTIEVKEPTIEVKEPITEAKEPTIEATEPTQEVEEPPKETKAVTETQPTLENAVAKETVKADPSRPVTDTIPPVRPQRQKKQLQVQDWRPPRQNLFDYIFGCFRPQSS